MHRRRSGVSHTGRPVCFFGVFYTLAASILLATPCCLPWVNNAAPVAMHIIQNNNTRATDPQQHQHTSRYPSPSSSSASSTSSSSCSSWWMVVVVAAFKSAAKHPFTGCRSVEVLHAASLQQFSVAWLMRADLYPYSTGWWVWWLAGRQVDCYVTSSRCISTHVHGLPCRGKQFKRLVYGCRRVLCKNRMSGLPLISMQTCSSWGTDHVVLRKG